jgi:adenylate cyclase
MKPGFFSELKRRNVLRAGAFYAAAVWALVQGVAQLGPVLGVSDRAVRWLLVAAVVGFPFWLAFAWFYEFTPEGLKRESEIDRADSVAHRTGRKLDLAIIGVLAVAVVLLLTDRFMHRGAHGATASGVTTLAVLPFENASSDAGQAYFSDGISEELLDMLARIPRLEVTARASSFAFRGKDLGIPQIARRLRVSHVLDGSVQKEGNQVRVTAELVDAGTDTQVWSQSYDRKLDDVFAIQDEIAADVVKQLRVKLLGAAPTARETDPRAYALFLQARELGRQASAESLTKSDSLFRRVLAIDSSYAPAWVLLSGTLINEANFGLLPRGEASAEARDAAERALAIDPGYAPAEAQLGWIAMTFDNDLVAAARHLHRGLELDPSDAAVLGNSAWLLQNVGHRDEALALDELVSRRDPVNATSLHNLGLIQLYDGHLDEALASFRTALSFSPGHVATHSFVGVALLLKGNAAGALAEMQQETSDVWRRIGLPMAYHALGRDADAHAALDSLIARYEKDAPYNIAYVYAYLGDDDDAFAWLDKAVTYRDLGLDEILAQNLFDNIRKDPRWLPFLRRIGKDPAALAKIEVKVPKVDAGGAAPVS